VLIKPFIVVQKWNEKENTYAGNDKYYGKHGLKMDIFHGRGEAVYFRGA
jgi:hypothetical protein